MRSLALFLPLALCLQVSVQDAQTARESPPRVVVVSVDGLGGQAASEMPFFQAFKKDGAWTFDARAPELPVTVVSHAAMLTGRSPAENGVASFEPSEKNLKAWRPLKVATVFGGAKAVGLVTAAYVQKAKLLPLLPVEDVGSSGLFKGESGPLVDWFCATLEGGEAEADLVFLHLNDVDAAGHAHGWGSDEQAAAIERAGERLSDIASCLDEDARVSGRKSILIVTADHGGHGKTHGRGTKEARAADRRVPWVARGPGIASGAALSGVALEDTAAVVDRALALGMKDLSGRVPSGLSAP